MSSRGAVFGVWAVCKEPAPGGSLRPLNFVSCPATSHNSGGRNNFFPPIFVLLYRNDVGNAGRKKKKENVKKMYPFGT